MSERVVMEAEALIDLLIKRPEGLTAVQLFERCGCAEDRAHLLTTLNRMRQIGLVWRLPDGRWQLLAMAALTCVPWLAIAERFGALAIELRKLQGAMHERQQ